MALDALGSGIRFQTANPPATSWQLVAQCDGLWSKIGHATLVQTFKKKWVDRLKLGYVSWELIISSPIGSMYAKNGNIYHQHTPNVCIYTSTMDPMGHFHSFSPLKSVKPWPQIHGNPTTLSRSLALPRATFRTSPKHVLPPVDSLPR